MMGWLMMEMEIDEYKDKMVDEDTILGTDIKINPDFYIHLAIVACQKALSGDEPVKNMQKYWQSVEHLEALMRSSRKLPDDYQDKVAELVNSKEYQNQKIDRQLFLKNRLKYEMCVGVAFDMKPADEPLKLKE